MKLVDILARELTEWAGDVGAITQDQLTGELLDYYHCPLRGGNEREVSSIADDAGEAHDGASGAAVTRAEWQAAVDALNAPSKVSEYIIRYHSAFEEFPCFREATSEERKLSGFHRNFRDCDGKINTKDAEWDGTGLPPTGTICELQHMSWDAGRWEKREILYAGSRYLVTTDPDSAGELGSYIWEVQFRPLLTSNKDKEIREMALIPSTSDSGIYDVCAALYEAGYRKEPKPCGY